VDGATPSSSAGDRTARRLFLWDATTLFFQVSDSQLKANPRTVIRRHLSGRQREIYIDDPQRPGDQMQPDDYQFLVNQIMPRVISAAPGPARTPPGTVPWQSAVRLQGTSTSTQIRQRYTVEIAIPWAQIGVTPVSGMSFGFISR